MGSGRATRVIMGRCNNHSLSGDAKVVPSRGSGVYYGEAWAAVSLADFVISGCCPDVSRLTVACLTAEGEGRLISSSRWVFPTDELRALWMYSGEIFAW